jgi:hypothetical protein
VADGRQEVMGVRSCLGGGGRGGGVFMWGREMVKRGLRRWPALFKGGSGGV